jgi:predicted dehydrogenase
MIKIGLIGYGYWGVNLLRNLQSIKQCSVELLCDLNIENTNKAKSIYPNLQTTTEYNDILNNSDIDAVVIATPVHTHYNLAKQALLHGKHVLVEKPLTDSILTSDELVKLAESKDLLLMVDHTFLYSGAVETIKELISKDILGKIQYIDSTRINLGLIQSDINVLWDLAPHDLAILSYIVDEAPVSVCATGISHTKNDIENIAYLTVKYKSDFIAHFNCSWSSPVKVRTMLIGGNKKMIVYDDINPTEKIKIYDSGYEYKTDEDKNKIRVDYRAGDIYIPKISTHEPLKSMLEDFIFSIKNKISPRSSAKLGLQIVKILEAAQTSLKNNGQEITI